MDGVARDGAPRVLQDNEYHRAVLISHCRRDPAALNATYALISALRAGRDDASGAPFSRHCHSDSRRVELWTDKEQLATRGGQPWNPPILKAMREGVGTVFFFGNAFAGSRNCTKEVTHAALHGFTAIPVWLEPLARDADSLQSWAQARPAGLEVMDPSSRTFSQWRLDADQLDYYAIELQGVPTNLFDMSEFVCDLCRATAKDDTVCPSCSDWSTATQKPSGHKLIDAVKRLGKFIDAEVDRKMAQAEADREEDELEPTSSAQRTGTAAIAEPIQGMAAEEKAAVELIFNGTYTELEIGQHEEVIAAIKTAIIECLWIELEQIEIEVQPAAAGGTAASSEEVLTVELRVDPASKYHGLPRDMGGGTLSTKHGQGLLKTRVRRILMQHVTPANIDVHLSTGSIKVCADGLPIWAAACIASSAVGGGAVARRAHAILSESFAGLQLELPRVKLDGVLQVVITAVNSTARTQSTHAEEKNEKYSVWRRRATPLIILATFFQSLSIVIDLDLLWPPQLRDWITYFGFLKTGWGFFLSFVLVYWVQVKQQGHAHASMLKNGRAWWQMVILARNMFAMMVVVGYQFLARNGYTQYTVLSWFLIMILCLATFIAQVKINPYTSAGLNALELCSQFFTVLIMVCGMAFHVDGLNFCRDPDGDRWDEIQAAEEGREDISPCLALIVIMVSAGSVPLVDWLLHSSFTPLPKREDEENDDRKQAELSATVPDSGLSSLSIEEFVRKFEENKWTERPAIEEFERKLEEKYSTEEKYSMCGFDSTDFLVLLGQMALYTMIAAAYATIALLGLASMDGPSESGPAVLGDFWIQFFDGAKPPFIAVVVFAQVCRDFTVWRRNATALIILATFFQSLSIVIDLDLSWPPQLRDCGIAYFGFLKTGWAFFLSFVLVYWFQVKQQGHAHASMRGGWRAWWQMVILARNMFAMVVVRCHKFQGVLSWCLIMLVVYLAMIAQVRINPYASARLNALEHFSQCFTVLIMACGMAFHVEGLNFCLDPDGDTTACVCTYGEDDIHISYHPHVQIQMQADLKSPFRVSPLLQDFCLVLVVFMVMYAGSVCLLKKNDDEEFDKSSAKHTFTRKTAGRHLALLEAKSPAWKLRMTAIAPWKRAVLQKPLLPYGGDIQAAMRAQDRDAIRQSMATRSDNPPPAADDRRRAAGRTELEGLSWLQLGSATWDPAQDGAGDARRRAVPAGAAGASRRAVPGRDRAVHNDLDAERLYR
eukprot:COSAG06_NODE_197_length_20471_cov_11.067053_7_plen_1228_part_00